MTLLVVGYGPGISHSTAARFGAAGHQLALVGRIPDRLAEGVEQFAPAGVSAHAYPGDAGDPDGLRELVGRVRDDLGPVSALLWTAFRGVDLPDVLAAEPADVPAVFGVGVIGLLTAVQACLDDLRATKGAVLIANGALGELSSELDHVSVLLGGDGVALQNAAKSKLAGLLAERLRPDGVYVGEITIAGSIAGTPTASPTAIDPDDVADRFWAMTQTRDTTRVRMTEAQFRP